MSARGPLKAVNTNPEQPNAALTKSITVRGVEYELIELGSEDYDECVDLARIDDERIDSASLLKFMLPKAIATPRMTDSQIKELPMGARRELLQAVNDLHFPPTDFSAMADLLRIAGYKVEAPEKPTSTSGKG